MEIFRHSVASFRRTAEADPSLPEPERRAAAAAFASSYLLQLEALERAALDASSSSSSGGGEGPGSTGTPTRLLGCLELCRLRCARARPPRCAPWLCAG